MNPSRATFISSLLIPGNAKLEETDTRNERKERQQADEPRYERQVVQVQGHPRKERFQSVTRLLLENQSQEL